jgi:cytochrome c peroxidase
MALASNLQRIRYVSIALASVTSFTAASFALAREDLDGQVQAALHGAGFTGTIQSQFLPMLGRPLNPQLADLGRLLWFDKSGGLHDDNTCGGCHSPSRAFGDTQLIAIGIQNNNVVGPNRAGPRNQRRTPFASNTPFYPNMMWNGRFAAISGDPFDNSLGFRFPPPEGTTRFPPNDPIVTHLSIAQAHMPPTELVEVAGFTCTAGTIAPVFDQFDDGKGACLPPADATGTRNDPIRAVVLQRLNGTPAYRQLFGALFPSVAAGGPIDFSMFARAIAEFEFTLIFADAPVDRYARGDLRAMNEQQKRGALIFFGKGRCSQCHSVDGDSNEMFSDFKMHVIGVPQIAPEFGVGNGNVVFDGPGQDEDFGLEQITGNPADRYKFRSSPLRNAALQAAFFHNGSMTRIEDAIGHHLDVFDSARNYDPTKAGVDPDLRHRRGPIEPVLARVDPLLQTPIVLTGGEFQALVAFVRDALLDEHAIKQNLCPLIPDSVPSGYTTMIFEECP